MNELFTGPTSWLIWLVIGLILGWLLEMLVDYLFWNRRYGKVEADAAADIAAARQKTTALQAELDKAASARYTLQAEVTSLQGQLDSANAAGAQLANRLAVLAAAGGVAGLLGQALVAGDDDALQRTAAEVEAQLAADAAQAPEAERLRADTAILGAELAMAADERAALQAAIADLQAGAVRTATHTGLVAAAGGLVGSLGQALAAGDEAAIRTQVAALAAELNGKADALWEAVTARRTVEGLEKQLAQTRAAQAVLQRQVTATPAAPPAPPAPAAPAKQPDPTPPTRANLVELSALALLLSGKEPPALDAERLQALVGEVETTRNVRGRDLLTMVDGIDEATEARLYSAQINTYQKLARSSAKSVAAAAAADPQVAAAWIQQAAAIDQGARPGRNRLTVMRNLDPAMQERFFAAGIVTYADLAGRDEAQVRAAAGLRDDEAPELPIWLFQARLLAVPPYYRAPQPAGELAL